VPWWGTRALHVPLLLLFVSALYGAPVPFGNEWLYLLHLRREWEPDFLLPDWTFAVNSPEHKVFNLVFGLPATVLSLPALAWCGRLLVWSLNLYALHRLATRFGIPALAASVSLILWLSAGQSLVAGEWIFGGFEAKGVAYALLFLALDRLLERKMISAGALLGFCFSVHPAIGLWAGLALAVSLPFAGFRPLSEILPALAAATICALPGAIPLLPVVLGDAGGSGEVWKYMALVKMPFHLDPFSWPRRQLLVLYVLFLFNWLHYRRNRHQPAIHLLVLFQAAAGLFFSLGLLFRYTESYGALKLMPFRLFAVLVPLLFFFALSHAYVQAGQSKVGIIAALVGVLGLSGVGNVGAGLIDRVRTNVESWATPEDDARTILRWMAAGTPEGSIAVLPPWQREGWYLSRRAQVASYLFHPYDRLDEWRVRVEDQVGPVPAGAFAEQQRAMEAHYFALTPDRILALSRQYGARYLLSRPGYPFPIAFAAGSWNLYSLPREGSRSDAGGQRFTTRGDRPRAGRDPS
jgi:hypothetical protein